MLVNVDFIQKSPITKIYSLQVCIRCFKPGARWPAGAHVVF